jgi:hypothetical protein
VQLSSRSDEELVTLARRGWPAPFAVLLHRHGATVRAVAADRSDPDEVVVRTFTRAMQQLGRVDPAVPVESWLLALVPGRRGRTAAPADPGPGLDGAQVDALWERLAPRWPRGRAPRRRLPTWLRWSLLTVVLMALAVLIPYATITTGQRAAVPDTDTEPLRAALLEPVGAADGEDEDEGTDDEGTDDEGPTGTPSSEEGADGPLSDDTGAVEGGDLPTGGDPTTGGDLPTDGTTDATTDPAEDGP